MPITFPMRIFYTKTFSKLLSVKKTHRRVCIMKAKLREFELVNKMNIPILESGEQLVAAFVGR